ncbi:MAG: secretion system protein, partial [Haloferacaceae archaeon]
MATPYDHVPAPEPPDSPDAWYAPDVRSQATVYPGVVATVHETDTGFAYEMREPVLGERAERALSRVRDHFDRESRRRPLTREGTRERAAAGFAPKYRRALDRLLSVSSTARRRVNYHALADLRLLGEVTPLALDERIDVVDLGREADDRVVVHTADYAPCRTDFSAETEHVDRVAGERL